MSWGRVILSGFARPLSVFKGKIVSRREWWGIGAAGACCAVSLVVFSAGGPFVGARSLGWLC